MFAVGKGTTEVLAYPQELGDAEKNDDLKYLFQSPQYLVIIDIRNNKPTIGECVDHVSSLFVNFDSVKVPCFFGDPNTVGISGEPSHPAKISVELMDD